MYIHPLLLADFYKVGHPFQYPDKTTYVNSNLTPRKSRIDGIDHMVLFGVNYLTKHYLRDYFNENFFERKRDFVLAEYKRVTEGAIGPLKNYDHIADLHELGYLPLLVKSLPEGSLVPMRVPCLTVQNTHDHFGWVTNAVESLLSASMWQACTSATLAYYFRKQLEAHGKDTGIDPAFIPFQGHDFSFRGMSSVETLCLSGAGHLTSFKGTDSIPSIMFLENYYGANNDEDLIGASVPASEHSVMCAGGKEDEIATIKRLITEVYPSGTFSMVSDTWDLWKLITEYLAALKPEIMARDGKLVIRPDSGDPVGILCGVKYDPDCAFYPSREESKGVVELLWDVFGGTINEKGYKVLDSHVGVIYGDSINMARETAIYERLRAKGFASQVVLGIGSFTYQYNTRDTLGLAMKATYARVDGVGRALFKCPVTDDGTKKSATGLLRVDLVDGEYQLKENVTPEEETGGCLKPEFYNGEAFGDSTLTSIRQRLWPNG